MREPPRISDRQDERQGRDRADTWYLHEQLRHRILLLSDPLDLFAVRSGLAVQMGHRLENRYQCWLD
jgi:hypothetical protein